ncbi:MAG: SBBP repeat-containing protein, partial [Bacillota bacterium]|nr:SBBP repeat-containing protein [Bacillota bacterium]
NQNDYSGNTTDGISARADALSYPQGIALDSRGNMYFAEPGKNKIYKVDSATGMVVTFAGNGTAGYTGDGGAATSAELSYPTSIAFDKKDNMYIADNENKVIRKVDTHGNISTIVDQSQGLDYPNGVAVDGSGNIYITGTNNVIYRADSNGVINTWTAGLSNGEPFGIAADKSGNAYVADPSVNQVYKISYGSSGTTISVVAGDGNCSFSGDGGPATAAELTDPTGVTFDSRGNLYIIDQTNRIRVVDTSGNIYTIAGTGTYGDTGDGGAALSADIAPSSYGGITVDSNGNVYFSDDGNNVIRKLTAQGHFVTYNGNGADTGTAPTDNNAYSSGSTVTVKDNTGAMTRTGHVFSGWNTKADGSGSMYWPNISYYNTYTMGMENVTLYAIWAQQANAANNVVSLNSISITTGNSVTITAVGDRQSATGSLVGEERYIPTTWTSTETGKSGTFTLNGSSYTSNYTSSTVGSYTITATFQLQNFNGDGWSDVSGSTNTKTVSLTVNSAATTAVAGNNSVSLSSSSVTAGNPVTITAVGDRQSATGSVNNDERYIPTTWTSTETGKSGTFTLNGTDYTSDYTPGAAGSYTITASYRLQYWDGTKWLDYESVDTKTTSLTVNAPAPTPTTANRGNDSVSVNPSNITVGSSVTITAVGDRQLANGSVNGDERYIPTTWTSSEIGKSGTFTLNGTDYTSNYTPATAGSYTITANYKLQVWSNGQWIDAEGSDTKTTILTVNAPARTPTTANRDNDSVSVNPSSITVGSSATITAVGDRQLANGSVNGDKRYIPTTWTSTETGKSGTFTLKSGNYTSNYTPSTAGSYIITASYKLQVWNGTSWIDAEGSDTKTAILTVKVPAPTPTTANRGNDSVSVNSSSITVGSSANITAVGDRQLANGSVNGDERYIPTTWTSSETGKLGTFTLNGSDYTSNYTPSTAGSYTITASYKLQVWNGTSWVDAEGSDTKTAALTVTSETSINGKVEDGKTGTEVAPINAKVITESDGTKTIIMKESESILVKKPDGTTTALGNISEVSVLADDGSVVPITSDGTITFSNMTNGSESNFKVYYDLGNGEKIVIGKVKVSISAAGDVNVVSQLIDPYGTITDSVTGNKISGVNVKLYYANTARNLANGKTPDTLVQLPIIDEFKPNNNQDPQISDLLGTYGWMVYPDADYYIVATKDGYDKYTSPTISVGKEIVKYDFKMSPTTNITKLPQTGSPIDISILIFGGVVLIIAGLMVGRRKKINKN